MSRTRRYHPRRPRRRRASRCSVVRELHRFGITTHRANRAMRQEARIAAERCRQEGPI